MDRIVMMHIGDRRIPSLSAAFSDCFDLVDIFDEEISLENDAITGQRRAPVISFAEGKSHEEVVSGVLPASGIIIGPGVRIRDFEDVHEKLKILLGKIFLAVQSVYAPLMCQRKGVVWILAPQIDSADVAAIPLISAVKEGVKALSIVAAMELARKKIIINYVEGDPASQGKALEKVVQWGVERKKHFLTAQEIRL